MPYRRILLRAIPTYAPTQSPSPCYSVPVGGRLMRPQPGQSNRPSHNDQRHYPHSAPHHHANLSRGFLP